MIDPLAGIEEVFAGIGGAEEAARIRRGMWLLANLPKPPIMTTPCEVVHRQNKLELRYYAPSSHADTRKTPVVVVPSLINKASVCDLEPDRSLVGGLAALGHPVYLVDWGVPGAEDAEHGVGEILLDLLHRSIFRACHHAGADKAYLLGYCQGGTLAAMYAALRPQRVAGLMALAAPVKFTGAGRFATFTSPEVCDVESLVGPDGLVDVDIMKSSFRLLDPMGNLTRFIAIEQASKDPERLARTLARERWLEENVPLPGRFAREFITTAYQEDQLIEGTWEVRGERVDLKNITCPVLVLPCARDFIAPPEACTPLAEATGSDDVTVEVLEAGHIGAVVGGYGPKVFYPLLDRWMRAH
ncbi:MAG: alpha/beta fold hydrolase [Deltaproteobacteria bacterium]|nr:MAG: alpha/beta fold hydrolase [Deltaproteobacteria bacterium]